MLSQCQKKFISKQGSLTIKNVLNHEMKAITIQRPLTTDLVIDGEGYLLLPYLVDPHIHFRVPGMEHKEDWTTGSRAAFKGGITTVFDMPNTIPPTNTLQRLEDKNNIIETQLKVSGLPLDYKLWFGVDMNNLNQINLVKGKVPGLKVFMTASTSDGCIHNENDLSEIFKLAKENNFTISAHAEDDSVIRENYTKYQNETEYKYHSCVHSVEAALVAIEKLIKQCRKYKVPTYILHISTKDEIELIKKAKSEGLPVFAETCPHYLFLNDNYYSKLSGKAKMNPPVRTEEDQNYLWSALSSGIIDTLASDHAPHTSEEKNTNIRAKCPSGVPGIETTLPLMMTAWKENRVSLTKIVELMHSNPKKIFRLEEKIDEFVLVNIRDYKLLKDEDLATKVKWSPYSGMKLTGYPKYIYTNKILYDTDLI